MHSAVWFKVQEEGRDGTSNNWGAVSYQTCFEVFIALETD